MSNFEDRLLSALKEEIATRTAEDAMTVQTPVRRVSRRRLVGLSAALAGVAAAATAVVVATGVLGGSAAYAVTKGADGKVSVEISSFTDPDGLREALADQGVKAVVDYLPAGQTCKEPRGERGETSGKFGASVTQREGKSKMTFAIEEGEVPADQTLVLTVTKSENGDDKPPTAMSLAVVKGAVAPCEATTLRLPPPSSGGDDSGTQEGTTDSGTREEGPSLDSKAG